jgi:hypothetical protein
MKFLDFEHCAGVCAGTVGGLHGGLSGRGGVIKSTWFLQKTCAMIARCRRTPLASRYVFAARQTSAMCQTGDVKGKRIARSPDCDKTVAIPHVQSAIGLSHAALRHGSRGFVTLCG